MAAEDERTQPDARTASVGGPAPPERAGVGSGGRRSEATTPPETIGRLVGQILMRSTSLSQPQLDAALRMQEEEGGRIGEILVRARAR